MIGSEKLSPVNNDIIFEIVMFTTYNCDVTTVFFVIFFFL